MTWTQLHLALNHIPVIGIPVLALILIVGWWRKSREVQRTALWFLALFSAASIAIKFTGDFAAEAAEDRLRAATAWVSQHEEAADQATAGVFVLALAAALALFTSRRGQSVRAWALGLVVLVALGTGLLYARTAHSGGIIGHPELRSSTFPGTSQQ